MFIILLGPPGGGKGTQGSLLAHHFHIPHISSGNLIRHNPDLTEEEKAIVREGKLLPDPMIISIVERTLKKSRHGWILDGFPRTLAQAEALEHIVTVSPKVIYLTVSEETVQKRLSHRRSCQRCDAVYHLISSPPKKEGVCDQCQGPLFMREDDKPEVIRDRLRVYQEKTAPLISFYRGRGSLLEIDASQDSSPQEIFQAVLNKLHSSSCN